MGRVVVVIAVEAKDMVVDGQVTHIEPGQTIELPVYSAHKLLLMRDVVRPATSEERIAFKEGKS